MVNRCTVPFPTRASPQRIFRDKLEGEEIDKYDVNKNEQRIIRKNQPFDQQQIKIFYININGLSDQKIQHPDLCESLKDKDIICFSETHLQKDCEPPIMEDYNALHAIVQREHFIGRNIKGVSVYCRQNISNVKIEEVENEMGNLLIIRISNPNWIETDALFLILCYKEDRESKYRTYHYFEKIKRCIIKHNMENIVMIGDLNGRIGTLNDNKNATSIIRKSDDPVINRQGREIIEFCNETSLIIANGRLEKGKCTYFTLHGEETRKSLIDYCITSQNTMKNIDKLEILEPVAYTDHVPIVINLKFSLKQIKANFKQSIKPARYGRKKPYKWTEFNAMHFDSATFKTKCNSLSIKLKNEGMTTKDLYSEMINIKNQASLIKKGAWKYSNIIFGDEVRVCRKKYKQCVGKYKAKDTNENLTILLKAKKEYNKKMKAERKVNKIKQMMELIKAKNENDVKKYWQLINQKHNKRKRANTTLTAIDFKNLVEKRDTEMTINVQSKCNEDYEAYVSRELKKGDNDEILNRDITNEEVVFALRKTHNSKSSGPDGIVYEILKNNTHDVVNLLAQIFNNIQKDDNMPWKHSWIMPIHKKGNKDSLSSYRCINLSSCIEKLMTKIINTRLTEWLGKHEIINIEQTGFKKGNSVLDNILLLKESIRIYQNKKLPLYICFVDLSKAFDSIPIDMMKRKLHAILPKSKLLSVLIKLLDSKTYRILHEGEETPSFKLKNGIPQGDSLSPTLFCLYLNDFFCALRSNVTETDPALIGNIKVASVAYADDILLLSQSKEGLVKQIKLIQTFCSKNGLKINYEKTKIMIKTKNNENRYSYLKIASENITCSIEIVNEYKYLGMWIDTRKSNKIHIENLTKSGKKSSFMTTKALKEFGQINGNFLRDTFNTLTISKIKYGGELCFWDNLLSINQIQYQFYKRFCHLKTTTPNYCLIGEFGIQPLEFHFYKAALRYWLRLLVADNRNLIKKVYSQVLGDIENTEHKYTWCWQIRKLLHDLNLHDLWTNQSTVNDSNYSIYKSKIDRRLLNYFRELWIRSAKYSSKGLDYLQLSMFNCEMKHYLNFMNNDKSVIQTLKFRTGNHHLLVETDRYGRRKPYEERICNLCDMGKIQDPYHVLIECPRFRIERLQSTKFKNCASKFIFYQKLNSISPRDLKIIAKLMEKVEETIAKHK